MPITQLTPQRQIEEYLFTKLERIEAVIVRNMALIGEIGVNTARTNGNYTDRTGNLRSSIGYVLTKNGKVIDVGDFKKVGADSKGSNEGKSFADKIAKKYSKGVVLVILAGMEYASNVTYRGYDVLDSAKFETESLAKAFLDSLQKRL